jgi:hypothetical protein
MVEYRAIESRDSETCWRIERRVSGLFASGEWKHLQSVCRHHEETQEQYSERIMGALRRAQCPKVVTLQEPCK